MKADEFGKHLRKLRKNKKITIRQLELFSGVSNAYLSQLENGKRSIPSPNILQKLHKHLGVSYEYLMEKAGFLKAIKEQYQDYDFLFDGDEIEQKMELAYNLRQIIRVPILGNIPAGEPIIAEENIVEWTTIPNPGKYKEGDLFMLVVQGDSMTGSRIFDGDQVLVKVQQEVESGEIAVVNVNGNDATLKRVKKTDEGQVILYPDNPKYDPIFITDGKARICGKVIQVMFEPKRGF